MPTRSGGAPGLRSQIRRGSNDCAANIVSTTTAMKYTTPGPGIDRHERRQLHERHDERVDEHVEHRPAPDELDDAVEPRALPVAHRGAALHA